MRFAKLKSYSIIVGISLIGSTVTTYFTCIGCHSNFYRYLGVTFFSALLWISLWIGNDELTKLISKKISWVNFPIQRLILGVFATVVYSVSVVLLLAKSWEYLLNFHFTNYFEVLVPSLIITTFFSLFLHGRGFLIAWRASAVDAERLQKESVEAQYNSLRNQVNPHFLFNSLNALTNLVYQNQDQAVKFIKQLSEVYRYVLHTRNSEVVALSEEVKFLDSYIFLQQIRFGNKLKFEIKLVDASSMVAPLALQILVENAIKHNVIAEEHPLLIKVYEQSGYLVVENNLQRKTVLEEDSTGLGLENIKRRYEFLSNKSVEVTENNSSFVVKLPILAGEFFLL